MLGKPALVSVGRVHILYEVASLRHHLELYVALLAVDRLAVVVVVVRLPDYLLLGEVLQKVVRGVRNLLVFEGELLVLLPRQVHISDALLERGDGGVSLEVLLSQPIYLFRIHLSLVQGLSLFLGRVVCRVKAKSRQFWSGFVTLMCMVEGSLVLPSQTSMRGRKVVLAKRVMG